VDARADDGPAGSERAERGHHQLARRREHDCRVELLGEHVGSASPLRAEAAGEIARPLVAASDGKHPLPLMGRDLADDVSRAAEAVEPDPLAVAAEAQRPVADQPGAEERRQMGGRSLVRQCEAVALVSDCALRVPTVARVTRELRSFAEVLAA
jgi:hypothetical protein